MQMNDSRLHCCFASEVSHTDPQAFKDSSAAEVARLKDLEAVDVKPDGVGMHGRTCSSKWIYESATVH